MKNVLVNDDEPLIRDLLRLALEEHGFNVMEAPDGREGLRTFIDRRPPLVITDIIMPNMDGLEVVVALKKVDPRVRVLAISGGGRVVKRDYLATALELGADDVLWKPFDEAHLIEAVTGLVDRGAAPPRPAPLAWRA
ncbi:MAG: response regulator [Alphaproteobacteria bacterium]